MNRAVSVAALLLLFPPALSAQQLRLKRDPPKLAWAGCPATPRPATVSDTQRQEAAQLAAAATEASLLGNNAAALELLTRAATHDPSSDRIAYRLARTLELVDQRDGAIAAYCRFLAIATDTTDAPEARGRLASLTDPGSFAVSAAAADAFQIAIAHYDAGRLADAEAAFGAALAAVPDWSDALYDRGVVRLTLQQDAAAADDLRRYLELNPGSRDFAAVLGALRSVRAPAVAYNPGTAFATGLLLPGLGHFTTGRAKTGLAFLGAAAATVSAGFLWQRVRVACLAPPVEGACPPEQVLSERTERPYLVPALGAAAALGLLGAIDAFRGAKRRNAETAELLRVGGLDGSGDGATALLAPAIEPHRDGARVSLIRVTF